jgi:hypothetical protein
VPVEDVFSRMTEIAALVTRVADPETAHATLGAFSSLLEPPPAPEPGLAGPIGYQPDALPWMPGGESQPLPAAYASPNSAAYAVAPSAAYGSSQAGLRMLAAATGEIGVTEEPPGSNDSPRIAQYRAASGAEATPGRWCAYFVSWAAAQAGAPLGDHGQGFANVTQIRDWGQQTGRLLAPGEQPRPGDIVCFGLDHVGIVESVGTGDRMTTVEGNHSDRVDRVDRSLSEGTYFVRL